MTHIHFLFRRVQPSPPSSADVNTTSWFEWSWLFTTDRPPHDSLRIMLVMTGAVIPFIRYKVRSFLTSPLPSIVFGIAGVGPKNMLQRISFPQYLFYNQPPPAPPPRPPAAQPTPPTQKPR